MEVRPGCAYILPPNKEMTLAGGVLHVAGREPSRGLRLPIDYFFRSLADDLGERAVGVVLSGTGSDGTLGVRAIKGAGGMAVAQAPETAAYDGMPRSVIATGLVDYTLAPAAMPEQLLDYVSRAFRAAALPARAAPRGPDPLLQVLHLLHHRSGHDFTHYKMNTLQRRVERRMAVRRAESMEDYLALLEQDVLEVDTLFRELLIGVTNFFRDAAAFETLATKALSHLVAAHAQGDPVRVWVPGCSTGEEAYSIAMLVQEQADAAGRNVPMQIFATDIDADAVERARGGVYPGSISADVSPERLARYFVQEGGGVPHLEIGARVPGLRQAGRHQRPALLESRPRQLPEPAHLHGRGPAAEAHAALPLRAQKRRLPAARQLGDRRRRRRPLRPGRQEVEALPATRRPHTAAAAAGVHDAGARTQRPAPSALRSAGAHTRARTRREATAREARPCLRRHRQCRRRALHPRPQRPLPRATGGRTIRQPVQAGAPGTSTRPHLRRAQGPEAAGGGALRAPARGGGRRLCDGQPGHRADGRTRRDRGRPARPLRRSRRPGRRGRRHRPRFST